MENGFVGMGKLVAVVGGVSHQYILCVPDECLCRYALARSINSPVRSYFIYYFFSRILLSLLLFICYFIGSAYLFKAN